MLLFAIIVDAKPVKVVPLLHVHRATLEVIMIQQIRHAIHALIQAQAQLHARHVLHLQLPVRHAVRDLT